MSGDRSGETLILPPGYRLAPLVFTSLLQLRFGALLAATSLASEGELYSLYPCISLIWGSAAASKHDPVISLGVCMISSQTMLPLLTYCLSHVVLLTSSQHGLIPLVSMY